MVAEELQRSMLVLRHFDSLAAEPLPGTEQARYPFWSPDSQSIAFFADGKLKQISVSGGAPSTICDAGYGNGGTWNDQGVIVFAPDWASGELHRVAAVGGASSPVTALREDEVSHSHPQFLPDGERYLYLARQPGRTGIYVQSLGSDQRTLLRETTGRAVFARGYLLFTQENVLLAQPMDPADLHLHGEPVTLVSEIRGGPTGDTAFSVSPSGVLAYRGGVIFSRRARWHTRDGHATDAALPVGPYLQLALSPNQERLALARMESPHVVDLWLLDLSGSAAFSSLTDTEEFTTSPVWAPDSRRLAFVAGGPEGIEFRRLVVGSSGEDTVLRLDTRYSLDQWTHDGKWLVYHSSDEVFLVPTESAATNPPPAVGKPGRRLVAGPHVRVSPDAGWVAYASWEPEPQISIAAFPSFTDRRQISTHGGTHPQWRSDGRELFYLGLDQRLMAVDIGAGPELRAGAPEPLFRSECAGATVGSCYAAAPDGQRFLVLEPVGRDSLDVVVNWLRLLEE
jgi:hypothetical protein